MEEAATELGRAIGSMLFGLLFILGSTVFVLLVIRHIVCWYWKINEISARLADSSRSQAAMLRELTAIRRAMGAQPPTDPEGFDVPSTERPVRPAARRATSRPNA